MTFSISNAIAFAVSILSMFGGVSLAVARGFLI